MRIPLLLLLLLLAVQVRGAAVRVVIGGGDGYVSAPGESYVYLTDGQTNIWEDTTSTLGGIWNVDSGASSGAHDLESDASVTFSGAYIWTFQIDTTPDSGYSLSYVGVESWSGPPEPEATLWDWWVEGWNLGIMLCGFGLLLRVVKGLRGPGSGEI